MKEFSIRFFGMLAFVLLCCFACTDHQPDPEVLPVVKTESTQFDSQANRPRFRVKIESVGNVGIVEYGVAYLFAPFGANAADYQPSVASSRVVFDLPATIGTHSKLAPFSDSDPGVDVWYYRAYARLQNGNVIYGDIYSTD